MCCPSTAFAAAAALRFGDLSVQNPTCYNYYVQLIVFFNLLWLLLRLLRGEGEWQQKIQGTPQGEQEPFSGHRSSLCLWNFSTGTKRPGTYFSRLFGLYFYSAWLILLTTWSFVLHGLEMRLAKKGVGRRRVALVGDAELLNGLLPHLESLEVGGFDVVGIYCSQQLDPKFSCQHPEALVAELARGDLEELFIATEDQSQLSWERGRQSFCSGASFAADRHPRRTILSARACVMYCLSASRAAGALHNRVVKRFFDLFDQTRSLILLPFVFLRSHCWCGLRAGSVFFGQERSGLRNETF